MVGVQQNRLFRGTVMDRSPTRQENHQFVIKNVMSASVSICMGVKGREQSVFLHHKK